jgi:hypothetical protein
MQWGTSILCVKPGKGKPCHYARIVVGLPTVSVVVTLAVARFRAMLETVATSVVARLALARFHASSRQVLFQKQ